MGAPLTDATALRRGDGRPPPGAKAAPPATAAVWAGFAMMCVGMFMAVLDVQVVAASLPTIQQALGIAKDQMSWVQTAYLIAEIIAIPLTGFLTRALTMRRLFVIAVTAFTLASIGCALSGTFAVLIACRVVQGFFGGTLIPLVFAAVFLLFPVRQQTTATVTAGVVAVLAPTLGPVIGGYITSTWSWPWLFLINVAPGLAAAALAAAALPGGSAKIGELPRLAAGSLLLGAASLAAIEIALKEAPTRGWASPPVMALFALSLVAAFAFAARTLRAAAPLIELRTLRDRNFAVGCLVSFVLGMGLFGSVYLMPVFLAYVRGHDALGIGRIMLVTGAAQLLAAPMASALTRRCDVRLLSAFGFLLLAGGLGLSAGATRASDFQEMFWPQVLRGFAIMFCILPPTELALGRLPAAVIPDASGLFNMMRNLGGAIGIALIDTVIYGRAPGHARHLVDRLMAHDQAAVDLLGVTPDYLAPALHDLDRRAQVMELVDKAAFVQAVNEAFALLAVVTLSALAALVVAGRPGRPAGGQPPRWTAPG